MSIPGKRLRVDPRALLRLSSSPHIKNSAYRQFPIHIHYFIKIIQFCQ